MIYYSVAQFAKILNMHEGTIRWQIRTGKIFALKIGDGKKAHYRISEYELERLQLKTMCEKKLATDVGT